MKIQCALGVFLIAGLMLLSGCATAPEQPHYRAYSMAVYPPKPSSYRVPIIYERPQGEVEFMGRFSCFGTQSLSRPELMEAAQAKARSVGADAILVYTNDVTAGESSHGSGPMEPLDPSEKTEARGEIKSRSNPLDTPDTAGGTKYTVAFDVDFLAFKHAAR